MREKSRKSNFTKHKVRIKIEGYRPERLISQSVAKNIRFEKVRYVSDTEIHGTIGAEEFKKIKKISKSLYRISILKETGVSPKIKGAMKERLLLVGIGVFVIFFLAQSFFVTEIEIIGCKSISEEEIRSCLLEEGLYEGGFRNFDCDKIESALFSKFDNIAWAKVAYEGKYVQVEIAESKLLERKTVDQATPCNVVAEKDCYIEKCLSYKGISNVEEGDYVKKGDILIAGKFLLEDTYDYSDDKTDKHMYVHASGKVTARIPYYYSFKMVQNSGSKEAKRLLRLWIEKNIPKNAQILNKSLYFAPKKNIIEVYGVVETRQQVGVEEEIIIDQSIGGNEENNN